MGRSLIGLAVRGLRSGDVYRFPVQYAEGDHALLVVPAHASGKTWWRNLRTSTDVSVLVDGHWQPATGEVVLPGDARHRPLTDTYARRWPKVDVAAEPIVRIVRDMSGVGHAPTPGSRPGT